MGIGAAFGAAAGYRYLKYGGTWNMVAGAVAGAALGGAKSAWQDRNTIQRISTEHYMQQVQACVDKSLTPTAP